MKWHISKKFLLYSWDQFISIILRISCYINFPLNLIYFSCQVNENFNERRGKKKKKGLESTTAFEMCPEPAADPFVTKLSILL